MPFIGEIDFSPAHDKLIRRSDGRLLPMDEPCYEVKELAPGTWQILSSGDYHYLVEGDCEAIAIDTGYGAGNLRNFLEQLCGKPVRSVINTHHHFDHTANNCYFDRVYMAYESLPLVTRPFPSFTGIDFPRNYNTVVTNDGDIIHLPGLELQIFKIPDHAPGSIAILDRKHRILFCGDEFMPGFKRLNGSAKIFLRNMEKLIAHRKDIDILCGGPGILQADEIDIYHEAAQILCAGERGEELPPPPMLSVVNEIVDGHIVYDCRMPRPEDRHGGKPGSIPAATNVLVHKGRRFEFRKDTV